MRTITWTACNHVPGGLDKDVYCGQCLFNAISAARDEAKSTRAVDTLWGAGIGASVLMAVLSLLRMLLGWRLP